MTKSILFYFDVTDGECLIHVLEYYYIIFFCSFLHKKDEKIHKAFYNNDKVKRKINNLDKAKNENCFDANSN